MKSWMSLKPAMIGSLFLIQVPLIAEKVSVSLCHQHNLFIVDRIILQLADKVDMDKVLDEFEYCPDHIICCSVTSP